jgi:integrase
MPDLSTATSRRKLTRSVEPHYVRISRGRSLGYRRPDKEEAGTWYARLFVGRDGGGSPYQKRALGIADDFAEADGKEVLSYGQAMDKAVALEPGDDEEEDRGRPVTVRRVVERYLAWYKVHNRSYDRIRYNFEAHVLPELGNLQVDSLTTDRLRRWHLELAQKPARLRGGHLRKAKTDDEKRARKVTANRLLKDLKAALNRAVGDGLVESGTAWKRVKPFHGVEVARAEYLDHEELRRFLNACPPDFRELAQAAVYTGARYSELAGMRVEDFRPEASAVHFPKTKSGAPRYVYLADEGLAFFERLSAGRKPKSHLLLKKDGTPWGRNHHYRIMQEVCEAAGIEPLGFHQLRHTYASLYLMSGGSLVALAKQLGHTTTRMVEKHYGHLAESWRAEEARKHAPSLGLETGNVARLRWKA